MQLSLFATPYKALYLVPRVHQLSLWTKVQNTAIIASGYNTQTFSKQKSHIFFKA